MDMNIIFPTTLLYDFMHLQFISDSDVYEKYLEKSKVFKYSKQSRNCANFEHKFCINVC
jgi:hypothetical protein